MDSKVAALQQSGVIYILLREPLCQILVVCDRGNEAAKRSNPAPFVGVEMVDVVEVEKEKKFLYSSELCLWGEF